MRRHALRQCCCGCSLRTGTILIAIFYLLIHVPVLKAVIILGYDRHRREELFRSKTMDGLGTEQKKVAIDIAYSCSLGALICAFVLDILLVIGALLKNTVLLFIWYIGNIIGIVVMCVAVVVVPFSETFDVYRKVGIPGSLTVIIFLTVYFLMVVHGFYYEIQEERQRLQHTTMLEQQQQQQLQQQQRDQPYCIQQQQEEPIQQHLQYQEQLCMQPLHLEQQHLEYLQQRYQQQQQQQYQQQQQEQLIQQQPAYNPVTVFTVASYNPSDSATPSAPPPP